MCHTKNTCCLILNSLYLTKSLHREYFHFICQLNEIMEDIETDTLVLCGELFMSNKRLDLSMNDFNDVRNWMTHHEQYMISVSWLFNREISHFPGKKRFQNFFYKFWTHIHRSFFVLALSPGHQKSKFQALHHLDVNIKHFYLFGQAK